ncbi:kinesin heavy chain [Phaffia rhodozyma]|uniref:Kinesin-like protein n=1 Tax=Phaffia rhodozyma TaxID=264483 RepID=A0A0F7SVB4_PHARH|nr:kinesin heavy chain [Phaffia rhodozyma]
MASNNIKVICRFRPLNSIEIRENSKVVVDFDENLKTVSLKGDNVALAGAEKDGFTFDRSFDLVSRQVEIYEYGVQEIVQDVMNGYNGTVFSYGQTGSGKTFTMMGADIDNEELKGITPRIVEQFFNDISRASANIEYMVKVSYMEIYMEKIRDLLAPQNDNLQVHEEKSRGVYVKGLTQYNVSDAGEVFQIMRQGQSSRVVRSTNMNAESSRSHSIFVISISQRNLDTGEAKAGHLYLVDLAGSEKIGKTGATGQTLEEAKKINKSLSALGNLINALTDGKSNYIPYRESKLTRILQESLGGNSRTTLIINCSPASYNEAETLSTLRFGMRAKSIKNQARVNKELSLPELKIELKRSREYISRLEHELVKWRNGESVDRSAWTSANESGAAPAVGSSLPQTPSSLGAGSSAYTSRGPTPVSPMMDGLKDLSSRPTTPGSGILDKDEREGFLKREGELSDQLAEKESALSAQEKLLKELRDELSIMKEQESTTSNELKVHSSELSELRLLKERLEYENKEAAIQLDALKEQIEENEREIEDLRKQVEALKVTAKDAVAEEKERKKAEKMAAMMAKFDVEGTLSEKEDAVRETLAKLNAVDPDDPSTALTAEDITILHRQLSERQVLLRDSHDRLRRSEEETEQLNKRREELEQRLETLEVEYEELLERTIREEEASSADVAENMSELKSKLEAQYAAKRDAQAGEIANLKQQIDSKSQEVKNQSITIDNLKGVNEELKRAFAVSAAGIEGGKALSESARDLERTRKAIALQLADFEGSKRSLMKDLQNRCEKVVELEIQLDELREHYNTVIKAANSKNQQKKMAFLERNLDQLALVQKQLVDQNTAMKKEAAQAERKLIARNERMTSLEQLLQEADRKLVQENLKHEQQLRVLRDRIEVLKSQASAMPALAGGRIAKPIRGGGGGGVNLGGPILGGAGFVRGGSAQTGFSGSPLSRVQDESGGGSGSGSASQKRASWFFNSNK